MNVFCSRGAKRWMLCAATGMVLFRPLTSIAFAGDAAQSEPARIVPAENARPLFRAFGRKDAPVAIDGAAAGRRAKSLRTAGATPDGRAAIVQTQNTSIPGQPSAVQTELQKLYERDGRTPPSMTAPNANSASPYQVQPRADAAGTSNAAPVNYAQPQFSSPPYGQPQYSAPQKPGMLKRLNPFARKPAQNAAPQGQPAYGQPVYDAGSMPPGTIVLPPGQSLPPGTQVIPPGQVFTQETSGAVVTTSPATVPAAPALPYVPPVAPPAASGGFSIDVGNPFPGGSEREADRAQGSGATVASEAQSPPAMRTAPPIRSVPPIQTTIPMPAAAPVQAAAPPVAVPSAGPAPSSAPSSVPSDNPFAAAPRTVTDDSRSSVPSTDREPLTVPADGPQISATPATEAPLPRATLPRATPMRRATPTPRATPQRVVQDLQPKRPALPNDAEPAPSFPAPPAADEFEEPIVRSGPSEGAAPAPRIEAEPDASGFQTPRIVSPNTAARDAAWTPTRSRGTEPDLNAATAPAPTIQPHRDPPRVTPPKPLDPEPAAELPASPAKDHERKLRLIAQRKGLTGFKGFCPVVLRDTRDLVDASAEIQSTFEGVTYLFSTADAKARFDQNPARYAPAASGNDVILLGHYGREVPGSLDYAVWYKDRLHLFSTRDSLETFLETLGSKER